MSKKEEQEQQGNKKVEGKVEQAQKVVSTAKFIVKYWKVILIAAAAIVVIILLAGAYLYITEWMEEETNDTKQATITKAYSPNPAITETNDQGDEINKVVIAPKEDFSGYEVAYNDDEEYIKETRSEIDKELSIDVSNFTDFEIGVLGAFMDNGANLDYYTEEQLHCLPLFIKAENSTQNLDLRPNSEKMKDENGDGKLEYVPRKREELGENEVPGTILVQRTNTEAANRNQEPIVLEYKNENDFNTLVQNGNKDEAIKYFTINDKGELVYATWSYLKVDTYDANDSSKDATYPSKLPEDQKVKEKEEYTLSTNKIAYEEYVKEYIMPFEFLVQLLVISTEPEFCTELVDYVLDSKIIINIQEEESIIEEKETREYDQIETEKDRIDYKVYLEGKENYPKESKTNHYIINPENPEECTTYNSDKFYVQIDKTKIQHTYKWELLEVDNWIVHLTKKYGDIEEKTTGGNPMSDQTPQEVFAETTWPVDTNVQQEIIADEHVRTFIEEKKEEFDNNNNQVSTDPNVTVEITGFLDNGVGYAIKIEGYESQKYTTNLPSEEYTTTGVVAGDLPSSFTITLKDTNETFTYEKQEITERNPYTGVEKTEYKYELSSRESGKHECNVSRLSIEKTEKIDLKRTNVTSTTTKYEADSNPVTEKEYYDTDTNKPGSGHGDKDTKYEKFLLAYDNNPYTRNQMNSTESWLYERMEKRESTVELIDTVKYLLYMYDGRSRGVTELEGFEGFEEIFSTTGFTTAVSGGASLATVLKSYENDVLMLYMNGESDDYDPVKDYVKQDRSQYKLYYTPGDGCLNFSYGIMVCNRYGTLNNETYFEKEGINLQDLINQYNAGQDVYVDVDIIDRIYIKIMDDKRKSIKEIFEDRGVSLKTHQLDALVNVAYQYGNCGQYLGGENNIVEVYKKYYEKNPEDFKNNAVCDTESGLVNFFITGNYPDRERYNWLLFNEGKYFLNGGTELKGGSEVVDFALQFEGQTHDEIGLNVNNEWCAGFVAYCYEKFDLIGVVVPRSSNFADYIELCYLDENYKSRVKVVGNRGRFAESISNKVSNYVPAPGDIITFLWDDDVGEYAFSHVGIVVDCDGSKVYTIEGNTSGSAWNNTVVARKEYDLNAACIIGYVSIND